MNDGAAIIVAGGSGTRFGGPVRKQYVFLNGRPILRWSLEAFERSPSVAELIAVTPADDVDAVRKESARWRLKKPLTVVAGGKTRAQSVRQGLAALSSRARWVAVHDAVRPLITVELIEKIFGEARRCRAAIAACPSRDTVKLANAQGMIHSTPPRETVWLAQTPQIFERRLLERAHARARRAKVTDDAQVVERLGVRVKLVESPAENLKVTRPLDLVIARALLRKQKI